MALIKCKECGRQISDSANVCMGCGAPVGGGSSGTVGNKAFENRIEEYKKAGYILKKRDSDKVKLYKLHKSALVYILFFGFIVFWILGVITLVAFSIFTSIPFFLVGTLSIFGVTTIGTVNIVITRTGNIEESGNVLKNK